MEKTRQWVLLTAVGAVAILVAGWFLVVSPQHKKAHDLHTQATSLDQSNATLRSQVHQLQVQQAGVPAEQRKLAQIATKIPDNPALPALIRQLSSAAKNSGVDLVSLSPGGPAAVATAAGATTLGGGGTAAAAPLMQIPVSLQVTGSYFNAESFFNALENLSRAMLVTGFTMAPGASAGAGGSTGPGPAVPEGVTTTITAVIYESPATAAVAPAAAPTAAASAPAAPASSTSSSSSSSASGH